MLRSHALKALAAGVATTAGSVAPRLVSADARLRPGRRISRRNIGDGVLCESSRPLQSCRLGRSNGFVIVAKTSPVRRARGLRHTVPSAPGALQRGVAVTSACSAFQSVRLLTEMRFMDAGSEPPGCRSIGSAGITLLRRRALNPATVSALSVIHRGRSPDCLFSEAFAFSIWSLAGTKAFPCAISLRRCACRAVSFSGFYIRSKLKAILSGTLADRLSHSDQALEPWLRGDPSARRA